MRGLAAISVAVVCALAACGGKPPDACATMRDNAVAKIRKAGATEWSRPGQDGEPPTEAQIAKIAERFVAACRDVGLDPRCMQEAEAGKVSPYCDDQLQRLARALTQ